ncbi:MAG: AbgT family transporter [Acidobacteriota bacterium]
MSTPDAAPTRSKVPHTLILLFAMNVLALLLAWTLPQGAFERETLESGRQQVVAGTYAPLEDAGRPSLWALFMAIPRGFEAAQDIIFFLFIIGGTFGILRETGAIDALIGYTLKVFAGRPLLLIGGTIALFAFGSSTIGMAEEYIPFVPVLLALCIGLGFDAVTAVGILTIGYGVGYGAAMFNPFTVLIAQNVAELEPTSGWEFRAVLGVAMVLVGIHHVWSYARRVQASPEASLVADVEPDESWRVKPFEGLRATDLFAFALVMATVVLIVWGIQQHHWYVLEMSAIFLGLGVVLAIVARVHWDEAARAFCVGAAELTTTALLIGFARSILILLEEGQVIDTIIYAVAQPLQATGSVVAAVGMLFFQSLCNLFVPSGSGQAFVTMPIMAPLGDLVGVERQVAVLAYQLGDGLTNILVPTNAVLIGILTMAKIPYERWLRFIVPFMLKAWLVGSIALATAVWIGYS